MSIDLDRSHLVAEMKASCSEMRTFPVIISDRVSYFHDVSGGYNREEGHHVVNLIHEVQGPNTPPSEFYAPHIEAHMDDAYYYLTVKDVQPDNTDSYPESDFMLSVHVIDYQTGKYTFADELQAPVDKRETEYSWDDT